jgi:hypothetical protein
MFHINILITRISLRPLLNTSRDAPLPSLVTYVLLFSCILPRFFNVAVTLMRFYALSLIIIIIPILLLSLYYYYYP